MTTLQAIVSVCVVIGFLAGTSAAVDIETVPVGNPGNRIGDLANAVLTFGFLVANVSDPDSDNDGVADSSDNCPNTPPGEPADANGCSCSQRDTDADGINDCNDNCPDRRNPDQADCDGDGKGDVCVIADGTSQDCNGNGLPDSCEPASTRLVVSNTAGDSVATFDGQSGASTGDLVPAGGYGIDQPNGVRADTHGNVFISVDGDNRVMQFSGKTGELLRQYSSELLIAPVDMVVEPTTLLVASYSNDQVVEFDLASGIARVLVLSGSGGLKRPSGLLLTPAGTLLVCSEYNNKVLEYERQTGAFVRVAAEGNGLSVPTAVLLDAHGNRLVASFLNSSVLKFGPTGEFIGTLIEPGAGGLVKGQGMVYGPNGNLFIISRGTNSILEFTSDGMPVDHDSTTPGTQATFAQGGGLNAPHYLDFLPLTQDCDEATITLMYPNGGEQFAGGQQVVVQWSMQGAVGSTATLSLSPDNGGSWQSPVVAVVPVNTGQYIWTVPFVDTSQALLRIQEDSGPSDVSDGTFAIDSMPPTIESQLPSGLLNTSVDHIDLTFSESIDAASFTIHDVSLIGPQGSVPVQGPTHQNGNVWRIGFPVQAANGEYELRVGPEIGDLSGNGMAAQYAGSFAIDTSGIVVTSQTPSGEVHVAVDHVDITLSKEVKSGSFIADDVLLTGPSGPIPVGQPVKQSGDTWRIAFAEQKANGAYSLSIGPSIQDLTGNNMAEAYSGGFILALADVTVSSATIPGSASPGEEISVSWTVRNQGTGSATSPWSDRLYLSQDSNWSPDDCVLGTLTAASLAAGAEYSRTLAVSIPVDGGLHAGTYYLLIYADYSNVQGEEDDNNNIFASAIAITLADFELEEFIAPDSATTDESVQFTWKVTNGGEAPAIGTWYDRIYLSSDEAIDGSDYLVVSQDSTGVSPLAPLGEYSRIANVTMSWDVPSGTYYLLARTDATDAVPETAESNNLAVHTVLITVPDLRVTAVDAPANAWSGQTINVSWSTQNVGDGSTVTGPWNDRVFLSADQTYGNDQYLGSATAPTLLAAAGASYTNSIQAVLPSGLSGPYYVFVVADYSNQVHEFGHEDNNINYGQTPLRIDLTPVPDLEATSVSAPDTSVSDQTIAVTWVVTNIGVVATTQDSWADSVYLSTEAVLNTSKASRLATFTHQGNLAQNGGTYTRTENVRLPAGVSGAYHVFLITDSANQVDEQGAEANNRGSKAVQITLQDTPDLLVSSVTAPNGVAGESLTVNWTVGNSGTGQWAGNWQDAVFLSSDDKYDPGVDVLLGFALLSGVLSPGGQYNQSKVITLPDAIEGPYFILVLTDSGKQISEYQSGAENNNCGGHPLEITWHAPNLIVAALDVAGTANSGQGISTTWVMKNIGAGVTRAGSWVDRVYLSVDATLDIGSDTLLGTLAHAGELAAGASYPAQAALDVTMPNGLSGPWYLFVLADADNKVPEGVGEDDNEKSAPIELTLTPPPDLKVSAVTAPESGFSGGTVSCGWTVNNAGPGSVTNNSWQDAVYLSRDSSFETQNDNTLLSKYQHTGTLGTNPGVDDTYDRTESVAIPAGLSGDYYVFVVTDSDNTVFEDVNENNNTGQASAAMQLSVPVSDLRVTFVDAPTAGESGQYITVTWSIINSGSGPTNAASWVDNVYVATDPSFTSSTLLGSFVHSGTLNLNATYEQNVSARLPGGTSGSYFVFVKTDANNAIAENDEGNNRGFDSEPVTVTLTPPPDLQVSSINCPETGWSGQALSMTWTVTNPGAGATEVSTWYDKAYLSTDTTLGGDTYLGAFLHSGALAAGASYSQSQSVTLPQDISGPYYLLVVTDPDNAVAEYGSEHNNLGSRPVQVELTPPPDLQVTTLNCDATGSSGQSVGVAWTVTNKGSGPTQQRSWLDRIYLSSDNQLDVATDTHLDTIGHSGILSAGQSYSQSSHLTLPNGLQGTHYLFVLTDVDNQIAEHQAENNNSALSPVDINLTPWCDLQVTNVGAPANASVGQRITVSWQVTNSGAGSSPVSTWYDAVYLSLDDSLDTALDQHLGYVQHSGTLAGGSKYTASGTVTLPSNFIGPYYVFVKADSTDRVYEYTAEDNNANYSNVPVVIRIAPACDLVVTHIDAPATGTPGERATVSYTIANQSESPTVGGWWDSIYLSSDTEWDMSDALLARVEHTSSLVAEASLSVAHVVSLPGVLPGSYHLIVRADIYNQVNEGTSGGETNNTESSDSTIHCEIVSLAIGVPATGELSTGQCHYYRLDVPAGIDILVSLDGSEPHSANELYVRYGVLPDRGHYDFLYSSPYQPDQHIVVPSTNAGTYYILVYGSVAPSGQCPYQLLCENLTFSVRAMRPNRLGNGRSVAVGARGAGFRIDDVLTLVCASDESVLEPRDTVWLNSTELNARFDFSRAPLGLYHARVTHPDGSATQLNNALSLEPSSGPELLVDVSGPQQARPGDSVIYTIQITNPSNVDALNALLELKVSPGTKFTLRGPGGVTISERISQGEPTYALLSPIPAGTAISFNVTGAVVAGTSVDAQVEFEQGQGADANVCTFDWYGGIVDGNVYYLLFADKLGAELADFSGLVHLQKHIGDMQYAETLRRIKRAIYDILIDDEARASFVGHVYLFYMYREFAGVITDEGLGAAKEYLTALTNPPEVLTTWLAGLETSTPPVTGDMGKFIDVALSTIQEGLPCYGAYLWGRMGRTVHTDIFASMDPNDIVGPAGYGEGGHIAANQSLSYMIRFENAAEATAAAREVWVYTVLNESLDRWQFHLKEVRFGSRIVEIPAGLGYYSTTVDLRPAVSCVVKFEAGINVGSGEVFWHIWAIDPATGEPPSDASAGFLPPNDPVLHDGEGFVSYEVVPRIDSPTGSQITATAEIIFDTNEPLQTNTVVNTVDAGAPTSVLQALPVISGPQIPLQWDGADGVGESGVSTYAVYVAQDDGEFKPIAVGLTGSGTVYQATPGHTYQFYTVAQDNVGNVEAPPVTPDAATTVLAPAGDLDDDNDVDARDCDIFLSALGHSMEQSQYNARADYDNDETVTLVDYQAWLLSYQQFVGNSAAGAPLEVLGDFARDGDVDTIDLDHFQSCGSAPGVPQRNPACQDADLDWDGDVDQSDFAVLQRCSTGSGQPANLFCKYGGSADDSHNPVPPGMALIPAGEFQMGDTFTEGGSEERPVHAVYVNAFFMDTTEVTNDQYKDALNWAKNQGNLITVISGLVYKYNSGTSYPYCDTTTSSSYSRITWNGTSFGVVSGKGNHPMVAVSWYGSVAYANWRSGMQGKPLCYDLSTWNCNVGSGYRLPTEAEWEKAARGGTSGHRFPWSDSDYIQHARGNYCSSTIWPYDNSSTRGYHPTFNTGVFPYTSPGGYFAANGYGLYDMTGNVWEWCNDWYGVYSAGSQNNPHGPGSGSYRVLRGGCWSNFAYYCRVAYRYVNYPLYRYFNIGFRLALDSP